MPLSRRDAMVEARGREGIEVEAAINDYISRELVQDVSLLPLGNATSLLEAGILDSLSVLKLVMFVRERFGITVDVADLIPENFDTVDAICTCLRSRVGKGASDGVGCG